MADNRKPLEAFRLDPSLLARVEAAVPKHGYSSKAELIRAALRAFLDELERMTAA